ncbi:PaaI family thioesterase [Nocardioides sp. R-C-SC26]|uniref:PaaI family thioesterase n=1 Tax=Nocardioides sp. R-C-SC26 TaxID=2870414 RepID=UPI001E396056|nr:PaaI family thioesterase [Nocardioides sp. R-C-SC26]
MDIASGFIKDDASPEQVAAERALYEPLAEAVRQLVDASIRTTVDADEVRAVTEDLERLAARLQRSQLPGAYGVRYGSDGTGRPWGNTVVGVRNPAAPPLRTVKDAETLGNVSADFHLGAAYEGPPSHVHGGVLALVLDQMLGEAAGAGGRPGMTATYTVTYRRPTPLGALSARAWISRTEGHKTWAAGEISGPDGVTVEAEGLFVLPRWAREAGGTDSPDAPHYF